MKMIRKKRRCYFVIWSMRLVSMALRRYPSIKWVEFIEKVHE